MSSNKPNIFKLTGQAIGFVRANIGTLKNHLKILLPLFLLVALTNHLGDIYGYDWVNILTAVPLLYIMSCFSLTWHGVALRGADVAPVKNPFKWEKGDGQFHAMFMGILGLIYCFSAMAERVTLYLQTHDNQALILAGTLSALIVLCAVLWFAVRLMFFLPAQSVGVSLSYAEIKKASKGSMWRFIFGTSLATVAFGIIVSIYLIIVSVIVQATQSNVEVNNLPAALLAFFLSIPVYMAIFFYWATNVTILSRLYRWGMENNA
jgi:hypothetical protein